MSLALPLRSIEWTRYRLPFASRFETAHGRMAEREGLLLRLTAADGLVGIGDAAPLVEFGDGTSDETEADLRALAPRLLGTDTAELMETVSTLLGTGARTAALRCALDMAALDIEACSLGLPVAGLLAADHASIVSVNATVGAAPSKAAIVAARRAVAAGFRTIKLKVGVAGSLDAEVARVSAVREAIGPEPTLRLDANGAWKPDEAIALLDRVDHLGIELIEQPVPARDLAGLARVRAAVPVPVAADEAVTGLEAAQRIIQRGAADTLIVKPMVVGGLRAGRQIIQAAAAAGLRAIVTTTIDSGVGVAAALHLAATLPPESPACGLATADLLLDDLILGPLTISAGRMKLPAHPGLGIIIDEQALARFAVGPLWRAG